MFSSALIDRLGSADSVVVLTGAGASAESGIPTFRDPDGLWSEHDPTELASMPGFRRDPVRVQSWYSARRANVLQAEPHAGHVALAELESHLPQLLLVTQNVDGLHRRAGSVNVIEIHGNLLDASCADCGQSAEPLDVGPQDAAATCDCGGLVRPNVVWFGETLDPDRLERAWTASSRCDVFVSIGTGADVYPAGELPLIAGRSGAYVAEINPRPTAITDLIDESVHETAGRALPHLLDSIEEAA